MTIAPAISFAASQSIGSTLRAAAGVTGMQLVYVSSIVTSIGSGSGSPVPGQPVSGRSLTWQQLHGKFDGISAGFMAPLGDTFDGRLLGGAPPSTPNADADLHYREVAMRRSFGIASYIGVPLRSRGIVIGTLAAIDSASVTTTTSDLRVLTSLARIVEAEASRDPEVRLHRTTDGWEVEQGDGSGLTVAVTDDLTIAMSLADLMAADAGDTMPPPRPQRPTHNLSEGERLRGQVSQLEHALSARVVIEQAIGVLAQRFSVTPRESFDRIRKSARSRGQRVHDLAVSIVRSAWDETVVLPADLQGAPTTL